MNRGRPREFDEKQALEAAMNVFWRKGFDGASCEELLNAMGINSGSMYSAFGDKQDLYDKAFKLYCETVFQQGQERLAAPGSPLENVKAVFQCMAERMASNECKGCFVGNTILEFAEENNEVAEMARNVMQHFQNALEQKLAEAQQTGELPASAQPREIAAFLVSTGQGLNVMARAKASEATLQGVINTAMQILP